MNKLFNIGIAISCTGLIMLFIYFIGNEILKHLTGVIAFWHLDPVLAVIAGAVLAIGVGILVFAGDRISRSYYYNK